MEDLNKTPDWMFEESEKPVPNDLEEAADNHIRGVADAVKRRGWELETQDITNAFIAGAKWQEEQDLKYISEIHRNGYNLCKEQMMNKAVEVGGVAIWQYLDNLGRDFYKVETEEFTTHGEIWDGAKVRIIILPKEEDFGPNSLTYESAFPTERVLFFTIREREEEL